MDESTRATSRHGTEGRRLIDRAFFTILRASGRLPAVPRDTSQGPRHAARSVSDTKAVS